MRSKNYLITTLFRKIMQNYISFILPTHNEEKNIIPIIQKILSFDSRYEIEIIVIDDNSKDKTEFLVRKFSRKNYKVRLISRLGRYGLSSAIKEGCLNASGEIIAVMDSDGQHEVYSVFNAIDSLIKTKKDLIMGSRFLNNSSIKGLSKRREEGSNFANKLARLSLSKNYATLTDYLSGCFVFRRDNCIKYIKLIDVNGFKFLYELLSLSKGKLNILEISLNFQPRRFGNSKLDIAVIWDFNISLIHSLLKRIVPRRAISFGIVGLTGIFVQLFVLYFLMWITNFSFIRVLPFAVISAASSNFLINNSLTFRNKRLKGSALWIGLLKFLLVSSLPVIANIGLASSFYFYIYSNTLLSQIAGIIVVFIWNYAASSRLVWNN